MFRWLTRNDGGRMARAKKRLSSPRGSVFSEFALIVPIVVLVCSALIEIVGYWDAQVMANHAAWQVGRIVMVRGSDGLEFSSNLSKKSKTGIAGSDMPDPLKKALASLDTAISGFNKFNNRGNIATLFLMSTCGIGYYGGTPGQTLSDGFTALVDAGVKALTDGLPTWIAEAVKGFTLPSFIGGGESGIAGFVNEIVKGIVDKITRSCSRRRSRTSSARTASSSTTSSTARARPHASRGRCTVRDRASRARSRRSARRC